MATALLLLAFANGFIMALSANILLDGAAALGFIVAGSVRQALTPASLLGQIAATSALLNTTTRMISILLAGILITTLGQRTSLIVFALLQMLIGSVMLLTPATRTSLSTLTPFSISAFGLGEEAIRENKGDEKKE